MTSTDPLRPEEPRRVPQPATRYWPPDAGNTGRWADGVLRAVDGWEPRADARSALHLRQHLYTQVHLHGRVRQASAPDTALLRALEPVRAAARYRSPGWELRATHAPERYEVARDGVRLLVDGEDVAAWHGGPTGPSSAPRAYEAELSLPRRLPRTAQGWYTLVGADGPPHAATARLYVRPADGVPEGELWAALAEAADRTGRPWQAKFLLRDSDRDRPDRVVLSSGAADLDALVAAVRGALAGLTADPVPGLARPVAPGIAVGVLPAGAERHSYGQYIAGLAARCLAGAGGVGAAERDGRLRKMFEELATVNGWGRQ